MASEKVWAFFWVLFLFFLENFFVPFSAGAPPFLLIAVIFYALTEGRASGASSARSRDCFWNLTQRGRWDLRSSSLAACGAAVGFFASRIFRESLLTQMLLPVGAVCLVSFLRSLFFLFSSGEELRLLSLAAFSAAGFFKRRRFFAPLVFSC